MDSKTDAVLQFGRLTHWHELVDKEGRELAADGSSDFDYALDEVVKPPVVTPEDGANVVSSLLTNGKHAPAIDIDVPAMLIPSSTPGHSHLYIDCELSWRDYTRLLKTLARVGIVEYGFYRSAVRRGSSMLRLPHIRKAQS